MLPAFFTGLLLLSAVAYALGRSRALATVSGRAGDLHSLPGYSGAFVLLCTSLPVLAFAALWAGLESSYIESAGLSGVSSQIQSLPSERLELFLRDASHLSVGEPASGEVTEELTAAAERMASASVRAEFALGLGALLLGAAALFVSRAKLSAEFRARAHVERIVRALLAASSTVAVLVTVGIVGSLIFEALRFFEQVSPGEFLFGTHWSPQTALRSDQVGSSGSFGAIPVFWGTLMITLIAMAVAVPLGLLSAVYLSEYASPRVRTLAKPLLEILAGIPTVVYGFFAALTVGPALRGLGEGLGMEVASESALAAGLVMGVMIIPFVSSLSDDVINSVPNSLREGSYGLGATQSETIRRVVLPAALPGIVAAVLLAVSRAIGETMIVVMAAGTFANLTGNPFQAVTTVTVQIVTLLTGDQEFDSAKTLAAFALGLVLFCVTLVLNVLALFVVRRYREQYD